jgi:hypothetical protein
VTKENIEKTLFYLFIYWSRVLEKLTGFAANQEIPRNFWYLKVHYLTPSARFLPFLEPTPSNPLNPFPLTEDPF